MYRSKLQEQHYYSVHEEKGCKPKGATLKDAFKVSCQRSCVIWYRNGCVFISGGIMPMYHLLSRMSSACP
jgi:hypothetical protein